VVFLLDLIPPLDLSALHRHYAAALRGQPPCDGTLLVDSSSVGVGASRRIASAGERNLAFRAIGGDDPPDVRTTRDFRTIHREACRPLVIEVLRGAGARGMVQVGNRSTDGTPLGANAARHQAMSAGYLDKDRPRFEAEIEARRHPADQGDAAHDAALGTGGEREGVSPPWEPVTGAHALPLADAGAGEKVDAAEGLP